MTDSSTKNLLAPQMSKSELQRYFREPPRFSEPTRDKVNLLLREEHSVWRVLFDLSRDGVVVLDIRGEVIEANFAFAEMLGYSLEAVYDLKVWDWDVKLDQQTILNTLATLDGEGVYIETLQKRADDRVIHVELTASCLYVAEEKLIFCICRDVTERKKNEERLQELLITDPLTGLLNRREFSARVNQEIKRSRRKSVALSLILFDIDHFKRINDNFGHMAGDDVLVKVASRVASMVRDIDSLCRWGGEEFALLLSETDVNVARQVGEKLRIAIAKLVVDQEIDVTASFGVATFQNDDCESTLIQRADKAMYAAKSSGRNFLKVDAGAVSQ